MNAVIGTRPFLIAGILLVVGLGQTLCSAGAVAGDAIRLKNAVLTPAVNTPAELVERVQTLRPTVGARRVLVNLAEPPDEADRLLLELAGIRLLGYAADNTWFARLAPQGDNAVVAAAAGLVRDALPILPDWKLHALLHNEQTPAWTVVNALEIATRAAEPVVAVYVVFHADVDLLREGPALVAAYGGVVVDKLASIQGLVVELPRRLVDALVQEDAVQWLEPALPPLSELNDSSRALIQAETLQAVYGLTGAGITVLVYDGGTARATHVDFEGRLTTHDSSPRTTHPTHVAGTIGGAGVASSGTFRGMAPGVFLLSYGLQTSGGGTFLYTNPGDLEGDYSDAIGRGADVANNSIGTNVENNGFPCSMQGDYGATDALIDAIVRGSLGAPFRVIWAGGNERSGARCDVEGFGSYYSIAPPAGAKNHVCIGAVNSNDDSMTSFSSWGPTDDGRMKPEVVAPGCQSNDDRGVTSCSNASSSMGYSVLCGTSMACPAVTGVAALLLQDFRSRYPDQPDPRNSTLKVIFVQTAFDLGNPGPDYQFGYGSVRAQAAIEFLRSGNFAESQVSHGGVYTAQLTVPPLSQSPVKVTLAWDDAPGAPLADVALVNDLDLVLIDPAGIEHHAWTLDPLAPAAPAAQDGPNRRDNLEQVFVANPLAGVWRIEVRGHNVPVGPQPFSLAASPNFVGVQFGVIGSPPALLPPNTTTQLQVRIRPINQALVAGSPQLHLRYNGGAYRSLPLTPLGDDLYRATLPGAVCGATPEFYFSAAGSLSGAAATGVYGFAIGELTTVFADNFESDRGWTVVDSPELTDGSWERGVPIGGGTRGDPPTDFDGSGSCYLTGNRPGNSDVDGGSTFLISPPIDLSGGDATVLTAIWYTNNVGDNPNQDIFTVYVSNNDGASWTTAFEIGPVTTSGWNESSFRVSDFVPPTDRVRIRYEASDPPPGSVVEAGVDAVRVVRSGCVGSFADCNGNGIVDAAEIAVGLAVDADGDQIPDECQAAAGVELLESDGATSVTEGGAGDSYAVRLTAAPSADVTILLSFPGAQLEVAPAELHFAGADWSTWQMVTVVAVDDGLYEGPHTATITHTLISSDPAYAGLAVPAVVVEIIDNDPPFELGDLNCSGAVDFDDIAPFVTALTSRVSYAAQYPDCDVSLADVNQDGVVNFADIDAFVALLARG